MVSRRSAVRPLLVLALATSLFVGHALTSQPLALARSSPTGGTITVTATDTARTGRDTRTVTCSYTLTIVSATQVRVAYSQATYDEQEILDSPNGTTRTLTIQAKLDPAQAPAQVGPQYLPVVTTSNEDARVPPGDYGLSFILPGAPLTLLGTQTTTDTNQPSQTNPYSLPLFCPTMGNPSTVV